VDDALLRSGGVGGNTHNVASAVEFSPPPIEMSFHDAFQVIFAVSCSLCLFLFFSVPFYHLFTSFAVLASRAHSLSLFRSLCLSLSPLLPHSLSGSLFMSEALCVSRSLSFHLSRTHAIPYMHTCTHTYTHTPIGQVLEDAATALPSHSTGRPTSEPHKNTSEPHKVNT